MLKIIGLLLLMFLTVPVWAQEDPVKNPLDRLKVMAYIDNYWGVDFNDPTGDNRPDFLLNYTRDNTFSTNLAVLEGKYEIDRFSIQLGLQAGDFPSTNVPEEDDLLRIIYKSLIGVKISERVTTYVGVMTSYIGAETPLGAQDLALTRSVLAENTPYFFSGIRTEIDLKNDWYVLVHLNNGWINNQNTIFNSGVSLGGQLLYQTDDENFYSFTLYLGNERQSSTFQESAYIDLHMRFTITDRWKALFTGNIGSRFSEVNQEFQRWGGLVAAGQYKVSKYFDVTARYQFVSDPDGVVIASDVPGGFIIHGVSANVDYNISKYMKLRGEVLQFLSPNDVFLRDGTEPTDSDFLMTFALQIFFPDFP